MPEIYLYEADLKIVIQLRVMSPSGASNLLVVEPIMVQAFHPSIRRPSSVQERPACPYSKFYTSKSYTVDPV